ncbi:MAG: DUF1761 domain-containing protein [Proteobacteria bacterium]|nr:DUF1761 domain-containing protein [Pseudomonadota bacterium]
MIKSLNLPGIVAALVVTQGLSFLWYGQLFAADLRALYPAMTPPSGAMTYLEGAALSLLMLLGVGWIVGRLGSGSFFTGARTGFFLWMFFPLPGELMRCVYMGEPIRGVAIDAGYELAYMIIAGALIGGLKFGGAKPAPA